MAERWHWYVSSLLERRWPPMPGAPGPVVVAHGEVRRGVPALLCRPPAGARCSTARLGCGFDELGTIVSYAVHPVADDPWG